MEGHRVVWMLTVPFAAVLVLLLLLLLLFLLAVLAGCLKPGSVGSFGFRPESERHARTPSRSPKVISDSPNPASRLARSAEVVSSHLASWGALSAPLPKCDRKNPRAMMTAGIQPSTPVTSLPAPRRPGDRRPAHPDPFRAPAWDASSAFSMSSAEPSASPNANMSASSCS